MLHHGDNLPILRSIAPGSVHLCYADPPFCTQRDFAYKPRDGGQEEHAYSDRWPSLDAFVATLRERVVAIHDVLAPDGCFILHCDPSTSHYVKVMLDGVFGRDCFANEIVWKYRRWPTPAKHFQWMHDVLLRYARTPGSVRWNQLHEPLAASTVKTFGTRKQRADFSAGHRKPGQVEEESPGVAISDVWTDIGIIAPVAKERTGYPTQKPEALMERIIASCSHEGDTVLDPFAGSGTTLAVAQRMGRRWVGIDSSPVAVRVATERLRAA